jgi:hypothetical protein
MPSFSKVLPQQTGYKLPWFMLDISNGQLITTKTVPTDIIDSKDVLLTETPIPGLNYAPIQPSGNGNRKVSFTLPLFNKRDIFGNSSLIGNSILLQQFHALRNQSTGFTNIFSKQFTANPKVLYYWGTGSVPLIWYVKKCDFTNKRYWMNSAGVPQFSEVSIELWLDENNDLYKAEEMFRAVSRITGSLFNGGSLISSGLGL